MLGDSDLEEFGSPYLPYRGVCVCVRCVGSRLFRSFCAAVCPMESLARKDEFLGALCESIDVAKEWIEAAFVTGSRVWGTADAHVRGRSLPSVRPTYTIRSIHVMCKLVIVRLGYYLDCGGGDAAEQCVGGGGAVRRFCFTGAHDSVGRTALGMQH